MTERTGLALSAASFQAKATMDGSDVVQGSESVLSQIGDSGDIDIYVNSQGGSVFAGFEIVNALNAAVTQGRAVTFYVSALAASIASYITSGVKGARVVMSDNAKLDVSTRLGLACAAARIS